MPPTDSTADPLALLLDLTARLTSEPNLDAALRAVTDAALLLLPADHASVRLLDPTHSMLLASARSGRGTAAPQVLLRSGEGVAGWVLEKGRALRIDDVQGDTRFKPAAGQGFAIRSIVAAPLNSLGVAVGVLSASSARPGVFSERDERAAQLLANCSVPPLERARLERLAMTDHLTLAFTPRQLRPRLREAMDRRAHPSGPGLMLIDLDDFKRVNDTLGHAAGDAVLRRMADRVREVTRQLDVLVRRGGDEFVLVMPDTSLEGALPVAERVRAAIAGEAFVVSGRPIAQTVSIGLAAWNGREGPEALESRADAALYRAKREGRNRVAVAAEAPESGRREALS